MHRNTLLVIIFLGICAAYVAAINLSPQPPPQNTKAKIPPIVTITPTPIAQLQYFTDPTCSIRFGYPNAFQYTNNSANEWEFYDPLQANDTFTYKCVQSFPIPTVSDGSETVLYGTSSATIYHDYKPQKGKAANIFVLKNPKTKLYIIIRGIGSVFDAVNKSLELL